VIKVLIAVAQSGLGEPGTPSLLLPRVGAAGMEVAAESEWPLAATRGWGKRGAGVRTCHKTSAFPARPSREQCGLGGGGR